METKLQKHSRTSVIKREIFLRSYYKPGKKFCELGKEGYRKNETALRLLVELQNRYPNEQDYKVGVVMLTRDHITSNGKYSLD